MKQWKSLKLGRVTLATAMAASVMGAQAQDNSGDRPAVPRPSDDKIRAATASARDALSEEGVKERDDLIKAAQERLRKLKGEPARPTTITDERGNTRPAAASPAPLQARPATPPAGATNTSTPTAADTPPRPQPAPAPAPTPLSTPTRSPMPPPAPLSANSNVPAPVPLKPRYSKTENPTSSGEAMEITAHESIMDERNNMAIFKGDVVVNHPTFLMRSEHLEVFMNDKENPQLGPDGKEPPFKNAIATGPMVEIERSVVEGGARLVEIAKARRAEFDGITGDTILTGGPPFLQRGDKVIRPEEENARIILKSNGQHEVKGRNKVRFQIKGGKGTGTVAPGLGTNLDSITKGRNNR